MQRPSIIRSRTVPPRVSLLAIVLMAGSLLGAAPAANDPSGGKACAGDNGGITLPPGFCATVFADHLGHARHMVVAPNGVVYVNTWSGRYYGNDTPPPGGFLVALQDNKRRRSGRHGHALRPDARKRAAQAAPASPSINGALYAEMNDKIVRYKLPASGLAPTAEPETIVSGLPLTGDHPMHPFAIDTNGNLFVDVGIGDQFLPDRKIACRTSPATKPCTELQTRGGIWRYDASKTGQKFSPAARYATGIRNADGIAIDPTGAGLYATQHGRDELSENWPKLYTPEQGANLPAEELLRVEQGADYGWPECYFDDTQNKLVLAPEYGGDGGKTIGVCADKKAPIASFPAHWAPNDLVLYGGEQFPAPIATARSSPFTARGTARPSLKAATTSCSSRSRTASLRANIVVFADGFAGADKEPGKAAHRPSGVAVGPDGSLYISDDQNGRIWRVTFTGDRATDRN